MRRQNSSPVNDRGRTSVFTSKGNACCRSSSAFRRGGYWPWPAPSAPVLEPRAFSNAVPGTPTKTRSCLGKDFNTNCGNCLGVLQRLLQFARHTETQSLWLRDSLKRTEHIRKAAEFYVTERMGSAWNLHNRMLLRSDVR
jgi:hypothetical protein